MGAAVPADRKLVPYSTGESCLSAGGRDGAHGLSRRISTNV